MAPATLKVDPNRSLTAIALAGDSKPKTSHAREIEVTLIEPGWSKMCLLGGKVTQLYSDESLLQASADKFDGVPAFLNHLAAGDLMRGSRDVRDLVGVYHDPHYVPGVGLKARLRFLAAAEPIYQLCCEVIEARDNGDPMPDVGLSADMIIQHQATNASDGRVVKDITSVASVDVVIGPSAGGSFDRIIQQAMHDHERRSVEMAGKQTDPKEGGQTNVQPEPENPTGQGHASGGSVPPADHHLADPNATDSPAVSPGRAVSQTVGLGVGGGDRGPWTQEQVVMAAREAMTSLLETRLAASGLPAPAADQVRRVMLALAPWDSKTLDAEIDTMRKALGKIIEPTVITGMGDQRVIVGRDPWAKLQLATDKMMGAEVPDDALDIPRLSGIRELYLLATGDHDFTGMVQPDRAQLATTATKTTDVTSILKNTLSKLMLKAYDVRPKWWEPIITWADWETLNTVTLVRGNDFGDLDTVAEAATYQSKAWADVEETQSFTKKGNYVGITLEMIANDDMAHIRTVPRRLANAAYKTIATAVSNVFTAGGGIGPAMADADKVFHANHGGNVGSTALGAAGFAAAATIMFEQADSASDVIGLLPRFILVPVELRAAALILMLSTNLPGTGDNDINPYKDWCEVVVVPDWTDATDWALVADPSICEGIVMSSFRGNRTPELFVADENSVGSMFTNDEMRIKARFFLNCGVADYRPLFKSNVAG